MPRFLRAPRSCGRVVPALALTLALVLALAAPFAGAQADVVELAAVGGGETAAELVGRTELRDDALTFYGYVEAINGLSADDLFVDPTAPADATARLVFFGSGEVVARSEIEGLTVLTADGTLQFHFLEGGGASFAAPEAFFGGVAVAAAELRLRLVLRVDENGQGAGTAVAELTIGDGSATFAIGGGDYRLGHAGLRLRWSSLGAVTQRRPDRPPIVVTHAGPAVAVPILAVTVAPPTATAEASPPPATPDPTEEPRPTGDCPGIETWLDETGQRLELAGEVGTVAPVGATIDAVDAAAARELAAALSALATEQRDAETPPEAVEASRLVVTALGTYGRGLNLLASAVDNENQGAFDRAVALVDEARAAEEEARGAIAAVEEACGVG